MSQIDFPDFFQRPYIRLILIGLLVFTFGINSELFWDDYILFGTDVIPEAPSIFSYWDNSVHFYKTWPLSYMIHYTLWNLVGDAYWLYKYLNLALHIATACLIYKMLKDYKFFAPFLVALLFLIHPMQVESVLWISQLNTILSTLFFIICLFFLLKSTKDKFYQYYSLSILFFYLSANSKALTILMPFFLIFPLLKKFKLKEIKLYLFLIPFFSISLIKGLSTIKGVYFYGNEVQYRHKVYNVLAGVQPNETTYISDLEQGTNQFFQILKNTGFYVSKVLFPYPILFIYNTPNNFHVLAFALFLLIIWLSLRSKISDVSVLTIFFLLALLPTLGITYIPAHKFSYVANRYVYLALVPYILILLNFLRYYFDIQKIKNLGLFLCILFSISSIILSKRYSSQYTIYDHNYSHNKNIFPLLLKIVKYQEDDQNHKIPPLLETIINNHNGFYYDYFYAISFKYFGEQIDFYKIQYDWYMAEDNKKEALKSLDQGLLKYPENKILLSLKESLVQ